MTNSVNTPASVVDQSENPATTVALTKKERYFKAVRGETLDRPPVWIMRQAGRYMPEYMAIRDRSSFDQMCTVPELSCEATMLPLQLLDIDALIVFNDILFPLNAMGAPVVFGRSGGPVIQDPVRHADRLSAPRDKGGFQAADYLAPGAEPVVCESIRQIRATAGPDIAVLGFAGAPFTMASYAIEGKLTRNLDIIKRMRFEDPGLLHAIIDRLSSTIASYLIAQIKLGGADAVQLFDTWAGQLAPACYLEFAHKYQKRVIAEVKAACPGTPITLFLRGGEAVIDHLTDTGADVLSVDWRHSLARVRERLGSDITLQGNFDPLGLFAKNEEIDGLYRESLTGFDPYTGYIANLGHGILPPTRVDAAVTFVKSVQSLATNQHAVAAKGVSK